MKRPPLNEKEAPSHLQEPLQDSIDKAAAAQPVDGTISSDGAELQRKMKKAAAREFVEFESKNQWWLWQYEPEYRDHPDAYHLFIRERHLTKVHCTPSGDVFFRLGYQWVRLTKENLGEAYIGYNLKLLGEDAGQQYLDLHKAEEAGNRWLITLNKFAKHYGIVSQTLPKLQKEGGAA